MNHTTFNPTSKRSAKKKREFLKRIFYIALAQVMLQSFIVHMYKI